MIIIVPARISSSRLKDKPLADICGVPMVVRVAQRALSICKSVFVATDSPKIIDACRFYGVEALLTDSNLQTGTDRIAQAASMLNIDDEDIIVNLQGDEPLMPTDALNSVYKLLEDNSSADIATLAHPITSYEEFISPNVVKVVINGKGQALYFSRAPIPFPRDSFNDKIIKYNSVFRHLGLYAYRMRFLKKYRDLEVPEVESMENLEQLRAMFYGYKIQVGIIDKPLPPGVDTYADLQRVRAYLEEFHKKNQK